MTLHRWSLLTLLALLLGGCVHPGDVTPSSQRPLVFAKPQPPAWLLGVWTARTAERSEKFEITADNIVETSTSVNSGNNAMAASTVTVYAGYYKTFKEQRTEDFYEIVEIQDFGGSSSTRSFAVAATDSVTFTLATMRESGVATRSLTLTRQP
ncbi:hypothetical protein D3C72_1835730 [compost metagenome]